MWKRKKKGKLEREGKQRRRRKRRRKRIKFWLFDLYNTLPLKANITYRLCSVILLIFSTGCGYFTLKKWWKITAPQITLILRITVFLVFSSRWYNYVHSDAMYRTILFLRKKVDSHERSLACYGFVVAYSRLGGHHSSKGQRLRPCRWMVHDLQCYNQYTSVT